MKQSYLILMLLLIGLLCGCRTKTESTKRLMERPDFPMAAEAAPEWVRAALKETARLEYELERR